MSSCIKYCFVFPPFQGLNGRLAFGIFSAAFGSAFQHGYNTGVLNAPQSLITAWLQKCPENNATASIGDNATATDAGCAMTDVEVTGIWSLIVAIFCVGGMIGGTAVGTVASRLGR